MVTVNPAPKTYTIAEGSAKGWTITTKSGTPPSGYVNPSGTTMLYYSSSPSVHWDTGTAPVGKAVETTITVTEDKQAGTTTYTGTGVDMGYVSEPSASGGATPTTQQVLIQTNPNLPLTKAEIEQQRGVSFPTDWGVVATPIATTAEGTMYSYSFYSISERESEGTAKGLIEEARTDIGKNLALSSLIALRRPENVLTTLYLFGKRPHAVLNLGADNPELEQFRFQQTKEIVQDIKYYQTHGGIGSYVASTAWESYPTQVMAIPYVGGMAVGKVLNIALPKIAGAVGGAVTKISPRVAGAGSKALGFIEKHPTATTLAILSPVIYGETKYAYDVGTSSMPESQKVGLVGTELLKTGIVLTALHRGFEEGFVPERKYYLQMKGGKEIPIESKVEPRVLVGKDEFPTDYYRNPKALIRQFESGRYTEGAKAGIHVTAEGSQFNKGIVLVGKGTSETWGLYTSPSASIHFARLGGGYYLNKPPIFKLLPTGDYPAMVQIQPAEGFARVPSGARSSLAKGNIWLETKSGLGKQYISPSYEAGLKLEKEAIIPFRQGSTYIMKDVGKMQYNFVMSKSRFGTPIPIQLKYYTQPYGFVGRDVLIGKDVGLASGSSSAFSYRPSRLSSLAYSPSRYSSTRTSSYPSLSSRPSSSIASSSVVSSSYKPSYSKSYVSRSSYSISSLSSVTSPYKSSISTSSISRGTTTRPPVTKLFPDWDMGFIRKGMFKMPKIERLTKYKPSAIGNVFNIRGRQPKTVTGMEFVRPISGKRGWLNKLVKL